MSVPTVPRSAGHGAAPPPDAPGGLRQHTTSLVVAGVAVGALCLLFLTAVFGAARVSGYGGIPDPFPDALLVRAGAGLVVGLVLVAVLVTALKFAWPQRAPSARGRATSLRTRSFFVIALAVGIPALFLSAFGSWAYYRSWETAGVLYQGQESAQAVELSSEVESLARVPVRLTPVQRADLTRAIAVQYGAVGHVQGAWWSTLQAIREQHVLPSWAIGSLARKGYVIGTLSRVTTPQAATLVAWRVGKHDVRYYTSGYTSPAGFAVPVPLARLARLALLGVLLIVALGVLGAWILSRTVVRPVRRLAEASGRLADGEAGVTVTPTGPRELRDLAVAFNDMNAKMTKAQEAEQSFLLSVSHELKTPLTSIRGYAEGLGDGALPAAEGAAVIGAESARLERLVGDLLDSARMRKSAFAVRRETVDLAAVAEDVARRYEVTARDDGLSLLLKLAPESLATADHGRVLQVVSNLVENAVRCTPSPGSVTISTAPGLVSVSDSGQGLTNDDLPRAFERFYLYSRYGHHRPVGTGLGLAIVKELTEAMGGRVRVSSAVGVGTAFFVDLPFAESPPSPEPASVVAELEAVTRVAEPESAPAVSEPDPAPAVAEPEPAPAVAEPASAVAEPASASSGESDPAADVY